MGMWHGSDLWVHDSTLEKDAWDRSDDRLEPDAVQSGGTPTLGI